MKTTLCLLLALPSAVLSGPAVPSGDISVAVFDFETEKGVDAQYGAGDAGRVVASLLTLDLSILPPLTVVDHGAVQRGIDHRQFELVNPIAPADAKQIGRSIGARVLVNGRVYKAGAEIIIAAKVVSAETGQTLGTMVRGGRSTPFADLISQLGTQIGRIAMVQEGAEPKPWSPATIVGTRKQGSFFTHDEEACVMAIDEVAIPDETEKWSQAQPLLPGLHEIFVRYYDGIATAGHGFVYCARPGASYEVSYQRRPQSGPKLWIKDRDTQQPVTKIVEASTGAMRGEESSTAGAYWWMDAPQNSSPANNPSPMRSPPQHSR